MDEAIARAREAALDVLYRQVEEGGGYISDRKSTSLNGVTVDGGVDLNEILAAYEAELSSQGLVIVPRAELEEQLLWLEHKNVFDVSDLKGNMSYVAERIKAAMLSAAGGGD